MTNSQCFNPYALTCPISSESIRPQFMFCNCLKAEQLKLTFMTIGSVLRGRALAPDKYKPVPSAVRDEEEVNKMLEVSTIKGGIKVPTSNKS